MVNSGSGYRSGAIGKGTSWTGEFEISKSRKKVHDRAYHGSGAVLARKKPKKRPKAELEKARRRKSEEESKSVDVNDSLSKVVYTPAPQVLIKKVEEMREKRLDGMKQRGLLEEGDVSKERESWFEVSWMVPLVAKLKSKYPEIWKVVNKEWRGISASDRWKLIASEMTADKVRSDPELGPLVRWWDELRGIGSYENEVESYIHGHFRRARLNLSDVWSELDAKLAELTSDMRVITELTTRAAEEENLRQAGTEENTIACRADKSNETVPSEKSTSSWDWLPEKYEGLELTEEEKKSLDPFQDVEVLRLVRFIVNPKGKTTLDVRESGGQEGFEERMDVVDYKKMVSCEDDELESSIRLMLSDEAARPDKNARAIMLDASDDLEARLDEKLKNLARSKGVNVEDAKLNEEEDLFEQEEENDDTLILDNKGAEEHDGVEKQVELGADDPVGEIRDIQTTLDKMIESASEEVLEMAIVPDYANVVSRELDEDGILKGEREKLENDLRQVCEKEWERTLSERDEWEKLSDEEFESRYQNMLESCMKEGGEIWSTREVSCRLIVETLTSIAERHISSPQSDVDGDVMRRISKRLLEDREVSELLGKEFTEDLSQLMELDEGNEEGLSEEGKLKHPSELAKSSVKCLKLAKDFVLDYHSDLKKAEVEMEEILSRARELTRCDLDASRGGPRWYEDLKRMGDELTGSYYPEPRAEDLTEEDVCVEIDRTLRETVMTSVGLSSTEREERSAEKSMKAIWDPSSLEVDTCRDSKGMGQFDEQEINIDEQKVPTHEDEEDTGNELYRHTSSNEEVFSEENIGKYIIFSERETKKYLPEGFPGKLEIQEFASTGITSLLFREVSWDVISSLQRARDLAFLEDGCSKHSRPIILYGYRGCGKSSVLSQAVFWARKQDWLVIYIPKLESWMNEGAFITKNPNNPKLWDQPSLAVKFCNSILDAQQDKLRKIPLKTNPAIGSLKSPMTLFDIMEYGSMFERYASQAFEIFREELRRVVEYPVLLAVDQYNAIYNPSVSFVDPESRSYCKKPIRGDQLTMASWIYNSHVEPPFVYGTFLGSLTESLSHKNFAKIAPQASERALQVPPYSFEEFKKVLNHYKHLGWIKTKIDSQSASEQYLYQLTSGFGHDIWNYTQKL